MVLIKVENRSDAWDVIFNCNVRFSEIKGNKFRLEENPDKVINELKKNNINFEYLSKIE